MSLDTARPDSATADHLPALDALRGLMRRFTTDHLVGITPEDFQHSLLARIGTIDSDVEGYDDPARQRDLSIKFRFGHDHDFGAFKLDGQMGQRHLELLASFIDRLGALPTDLTGKRVLDIGCWTGGACLALAAMGAQVVAIEEVRKYATCAQDIANAFGLQDQIRVLPLSLYELTGEEHQDAYDYVLFAGVLYHLTDPVLALRHCFNALRDGGTCLIETAGIDDQASTCRYEGPGVFHAGSESELNRSGWNWFLPSAPALRRMIADAGFADVHVQGPSDNRLLARARRDTHTDMLRAGLSVPHVR